MAFSALIRTLERSQLAAELLSKLQQQGMLHLNGLPRLPKGLIASVLAQDSHLLVVTATNEEAGRWAAQLDAMGWQTVQFYPTAESSPYGAVSRESELIWGQMQGIAEIIHNYSQPIAIVGTTQLLQPHLPAPAEFAERCLTLQIGQTGDVEAISTQLVSLGYDRVPLVETEGQWSRRGDIIDIFPVAAELPIRLEWFGDELSLQ
jgi:transcription-repair coupling factor (superfamily II helicase)